MKNNEFQPERNDHDGTVEVTYIEIGTPQEFLLYEFVLRSRGSSPQMHRLAAAFVKYKRTMRY